MLHITPAKHISQSCVGTCSYYFTQATFNTLSKKHVTCPIKCNVTCPIKCNVTCPINTNYFSQNSREAVQLLLIHGADVNQIDEKRQTALHHATILGYTDLACLLLKKGADHRRVNTDNKVCQFWKFPFM